MNENLDKYKNIINLPHPVSKTHPQMSIHDRAAQFAPFAALTGYGEEVEETGRFIERDERIIQTEDSLQEMNYNLQRLLSGIGEGKKAEFTVFVPDEKKDGGCYRYIEGEVLRYDTDKRLLTLTDGQTIRLDDIENIKLR